MKKRKRPIAIDLFCGAGGMSLGFEQAGFDVVGAIDVEENNTNIYKHNFPSAHVLCADVSALSGDTICQGMQIHNKEIDVLFGGPPCQGFSLIGKRIPEDPRNSLLYEFGRIIVEICPSYFVVENVAGILLGEATKALDRFTRIVEQAGYHLIKPIQILDAAEFGVPQRRRRVFLLGYASGATPPEYPRATVPAGDGGKGDGPTVWDAIGDLPSISEHDQLLDCDSYFGRLGKPSPYAKILRGEAHDPTDKSAVRDTNGNGLGGCLRTLHTTKTLRRFKSTKPGESESISRFYRLTKDGLAPTLRAGTGPDQGSFMAPRPIHPIQDRCITVREAARLHSFPDWFHFHATKWHGFRQVGNSVPPRLARAVAASVLRSLQAK